MDGEVCCALVLVLRPKTLHSIIAKHGEDNGQVVACQAGEGAALNHKSSSSGWPGLICRIEDVARRSRL